MKNTLTIAVLSATIALSGCDIEGRSDRLEGKWTLDCQLENNVYSGIEGDYEFDDGMFYADMRSCDLSENPRKELSVEFPYTFGNYVMLGEGLEARELIIHVDSGYRIMALVYEEERDNGEEDRLYWTWGLNNTSIEHSIFGFASNETETYWGGYLVTPIDDDNYAPIKSLDGLNINTNFDKADRDDDYDLDVERPTTVNFGAYLED